MTMLTTAPAQPQQKAPTIGDPFVAMARDELRAGHSIREITETVQARTQHLPGFQRDVWWCELKHALAARDLAKDGLGAWYDHGVHWDTRINHALDRLAGDER